MKLSSPTSLLLNLGHAMDHWVLAIFLYTVSGNPERFIDVFGARVLPACAARPAT